MGGARRPETQMPGRTKLWARERQTRIYTFAQLAPSSKQEKKCAPVIPAKMRLGRDRRAERVGVGHLPGGTEARIGRAAEKLAAPQRRIELREGDHLARGNAPGEMRRHELARVIEAGRRDELGKRLQRRGVEMLDALGLVGHDEGALAPRILRPHAGRTAVGVAALRLDASEREHESARR